MSLFSLQSTGSTVALYKVDAPQGVSMLRQLLCGLVLVVSCLPALAAASATPVPSLATPVAGPVLLSYDEVGPVYNAARDEILRAGRENLDLLMAGQTTALAERFDASLKPLISE